MTLTKKAQPYPQETNEEDSNFITSLQPLASWTIEEDEYFWLELIPKSIFAFPPPKDGYDVDRLGIMMQARFGPKAPREYNRDEIQSHYEAGLFTLLPGRSEITAQHRKSRQTFQDLLLDSTEDA